MQRQFFCSFLVIALVAALYKMPLENSRLKRNLASNESQIRAQLTLEEIDQNYLKFLMIKRKISRKVLSSAVMGLNSNWEKTEYYKKLVSSQKNRVTAQKAIDILESLILEYPGNVESFLKLKEEIHRIVIDNENRINQQVQNPNKILREQYELSLHLNYSEKYEKLMAQFEKGYLEGLEYLNDSKIPRSKVNKILEKITYESIRSKGEVFDQFKRLSKNLSLYDTWSILSMAYENSNKLLFQHRRFVELAYEISALAELRYKEALLQFDPTKVHKHEFIPIEAAKFYLAVTIVELYKAKKANDPTIWRSYVESLEEPQTWIGFALFVKGARMYSDAVSRRYRSTFEKVYKRKPNEMALAHFMASKPIAQYMHSMMSMSAGFLLQEVSMDVWNDNDFSLLRDSLLKKNAYKSKQMRSQAYSNLWKRMVTLKGSKNYLFKKSGHLLDLLVTSASMTGVYLGAAKINSKVKEISPKLKDGVKKKWDKINSKLNNINKKSKIKKSKFVLKGFKFLNKGRKVFTPIVGLSQWAVSKTLSLSSSGFVKGIGQTVLFLGMVEFWSDLISKNIERYSIRSTIEDIEKEIFDEFKNMKMDSDYGLLRLKVKELDKEYQNYEYLLLDDLEFTKSRWFNSLETMYTEINQTRSYYTWISNGAKLQDEFYKLNEYSWHAPKTIELFLSENKSHPLKKTSDFVRMSNIFNSYFCGPLNSSFHYDENFGTYTLNPRNLVIISGPKECLSKINPMTGGTHFSYFDFYNKPIQYYDSVRSWPHRASYLHQCHDEVSIKSKNHKKRSTIGTGEITNLQKDCLEKNKKILTNRLKEFNRELDTLQSREVKKLVDNQHEVIKKKTLETYDYDSDLSEFFSKRMYYTFNLYAQSLDSLITSIRSRYSKLVINSEIKRNLEGLELKLLDLQLSLKEFKELYYDLESQKWRFSNGKDLNSAEEFIDLDGLAESIDLTDYDGIEKQRLAIINKFINLFRESFIKFKEIKLNRHQFTD